MSIPLPEWADVNSPSLARLIQTALHYREEMDRCYAENGCTTCSKNLDDALQALADAISPNPANTEPEWPDLNSPIGDAGRDTCAHCGGAIGQVWYPQNSTPENRCVVWVHLAPHDSYSPAACPPTVAAPPSEVIG